MRDRLKELKEMGNVKVVKKRRESDDSDVEKGESGKLLGKDEWSNMDKFFAHVEHISKEINLLESLFVRVQKLHSSLMIDPDTKEVTNELNKLYVEFTINMKKCNQLIKDLDKAVLRKGDDVALEAAENRIRRDQVNTLTRRFLTVTNKMSEEQLSYKAKSRKKYKEYLKVLGTDLPEDVIDECVEKGNLQEHVKGVILCHDQTKALHEDVKARTDDILKLEDSIRELAEMFHDLHLLVVSQGEILNNIEINVERSAEYSVKAREDLLAARKAKERARWMKIGMIIGVILLIFILFFIIKTLICVYVPFVCG